jgi:hypothetical protein
VDRLLIADLQFNAISLWRQFSANGLQIAPEIVTLTVAFQGEIQIFRVPPMGI